MKKVPTNKAGVYGIVDDADYDNVSKWKWSVIPSSGGYYLKRTDTTAGVRRTMYLHRLIMGEPQDMCIDHINGDTLDNRRSNLRIATLSQNQQNRIEHRNGQPVGVYKRKDGFYHAQKNINGKVTYIGVSKDKDVAIEMYNKFLSN